MAATKNILAFDLGAESGRAVVGSLDGGKLRLDITHRFPNGPTSLAGTMHWDALGLFAEMKKGMAASLEKCSRIASLGCDTWGVDFGLLASDGSLVGNPVHYRDARTNGMLEAAFERVPREEVYRSTGIQFMQINTLYQLFSMALRKSPLLDVADRMLMMAGLFHHFFTGEAVAEFSLATTSQMYNPIERDWARDLLEKLGVPTDILPQVVPCGTPIGDLRSDIADEVGGAGIRVIAPACHDTAAAVAAAPAKGDDWAYLSSGTWSLMGAEIPQPNVSDKALEYNFTNEGGVGGTIRFLKNIMGLWLVQQCRHQWDKGGDALDYAAITRMASDAKPFLAMVDPDDPSFLNPPDMPAAIVDCCRRTGQTAPADRGAIVRCALESLALCYRSTLERLDEVLGKKHATLHIVGGGSQNDLLNQMAADACGVRVVAGPVEATAAGNILMQAVALGELSDVAEVRRVVRDSFEVRTFEPSADTAAWDQAYERFKQLTTGR